ncbi:MAG: enoyl-CoA hydratase-related protein [Archangium sp.]|nr:enoyl-CoA hydratase-related protein [Archangium sp.]MDP3572750.1 enoyl-CoA hydratase-related protein [Archangium sp.]
MPRWWFGDLGESEEVDEEAPRFDALVEAFLAFERDDEAKVAVLCGEGGTFCAGADLKSIGTERQNRVEPSRLELSKPAIAAIAGHAVAGCLELASWCDLRVAEADAVLGVFCRRSGAPFTTSSTRKFS